MKTKQSLLRILVLIIVLFITSIQLFPQTIKTKYGTIKLGPIGKIIGPVQARSARRTAEIAIEDVTKEINDLVKVRKGLKPAIKELKKDLKNYEFDEKLYYISLKPHNKKVKAYDIEVSIHDAQVISNDKTIEILNKGDRKNQTLARRLNAETDRLNVWLSKLNNKKAEIDSTKLRLDNYKVKLVKDAAIINAEYKHLKYQLNDITFKMGVAFKQLIMLKKYTKDINVVLKKWDKISINGDWSILPMEELKFWSNKGWD